MNTKHSDLIAIANANLAKKLELEPSPTIEAGADAPPAKAGSFREDVWKAVYSLNLIRYLVGISFLILEVAPNIEEDWVFFDDMVHPRLFFFGTIFLLISAVIFSYLSKYQEIRFNVLVTAQFSFDVILAALFTHASGGIESNFAMLYVVVVATGSVVLPRTQALGLGSGAIILLFFEHFYGVWALQGATSANYNLLARYGLMLLATGLLISYLAERIRIAELKRFVPGDESIEDFLIREETNALKEALLRSGGNKTEAAKLLGMTFRSFRYKLTKYDID
ncbi:MAG: hypothetical protein HKN85_11950 [Gammaproteobacteria bacterium]|nr:hypothetical protein [Gammaproteobacteria bacterium]